MRRVTVTYEGARGAPSFIGVLVSCGIVKHEAVEDALFGVRVSIPVHADSGVACEVSEYEHATSCGDDGLPSPAPLVERAGA